MDDIKLKKYQRRVSEAEGYLDLLHALGHEHRPSITSCETLAHRALDILRPLKPRRGRRQLRFRIAFLRGQAYIAMDRFHDALEHLWTAVALEGDDVQTWLSLGWCYKRTGRLDLAIESLEEALSIEPDRAILHYNLSCYWSMAGNTRLAIAYLANSFEIDESFRDLVPTESDFDTIRQHPDFLALTSVIV